MAPVFQALAAELAITGVCLGFLVAAGISGLEKDEA